MKVEVQLSNLPGTEAAVGWAGAHTVVADRPPGAAGGRGLGFNGAQLLALALGGCFCNDLRYVAEKLGSRIGSIDTHVMLELEGDPLVTTSATLQVHVTTLDGSDPDILVEQARKSCMVSNSLTRGLPVRIESNSGTD
jgi:organic hydroperoxide reductase OsmC/OhrA